VRWPLYAALLALAACTQQPPPPQTDSQPSAASDPATAELIAPVETWGGSGGRVAIQSTMRAATPEEWEAMWALAGRQPPRPLAVGREVAAGIFLGERPTGGYGVRILGLAPGRRDDAGTHPVIWKESAPPEDAMVTQAITRPWQIAVFPAKATRTSFGGMR
jgi:hypothetical protein